MLLSGVCAFFPYLCYQTLIQQNHFAVCVHDKTTQEFMTLQKGAHIEILCSNDGDKFPGTGAERMFNFSGINEEIRFYSTIVAF